MIARRSQRAGLREIWAVWLLFALAAVAVFETYWRIPPAALWQAHHPALAGGTGAVRASRAAVRLRLALWLFVLFWATPYIAAELGFHLDGVPFFGWLFQTGKLAPEPGSGELHATVHYGHHHGLDGFLLATTALLLSGLLG